MEGALYADADEMVVGMPAGCDVYAAVDDIIVIVAIAAVTLVVPLVTFGVGLSPTNPARCAALWAENWPKTEKLAENTMTSANRSPMSIPATKRLLSMFNENSPPRHN
jgi:hypothetical protein